MKKIIEFVYGTKVASRVLFYLWFGFSILGSGFTLEGILICFVVLGILFLVPAAIIEYCNNPVLDDVKTKIKISKLKSQMVYEERKKQNAIKLQELNKERQQQKQRIEEELELLQKEIDDNYEELIDISIVDGMEGHQFEYYCAELLKKNGFYDVNVTQGSGDQGVDVLAVKDGIRYAIQCKNYSTHLGNTPVQEVHAGKAFYNCHVGVVMTNSKFTPGAVALAQATGVLLWDRDAVQQLMIAEQ